MKYALAILLAAIQSVAIGQVVAGFENFNLAPGNYINNAAPADEFESGSIRLPNDYNAEFSFWSGFAISSDTNTMTPGFLNQYSAYPGSGAVGTTTYAMGYIYDPVIIHLKEQAIGKAMIGMYVANSTYSYLSMRDGDGFAKKFGGETGTDPDFFMMTIKKYSGGVLSDDSINVYLADYRSSNPQKDFILEGWKHVDLSILGEVDSLVLSLRSSDVGTFGMNTPAYVAVDQISTDNLLSASALNSTGSNVRVSPNPASESLFIELGEKSHCTLTSVFGVPVWSATLAEGNHQIQISDLAPGIYFLSGNGLFVTRIMIN